MGQINRVLHLKKNTDRLDHAQKRARRMIKYMGIILYMKHLKGLDIFKLKFNSLESEFWCIPYFQIHNIFCTRMHFILVILKTK